MTQNKNFKRLVRDRMKKTGESYAAARHQLVRDRDADPDEYDDLADMASATVRDKTGRDWAGWLAVLDAAGARRMDHAQIAAYLGAEHGEMGAWWAQTVAIGYERIRGLRVKGQSSTGSFDANKSKTYGVPVQRLYDAWFEADQRDQWLTGVAYEMRTCSPPKSVRMKFADGTAVNAWFTDKGPTKSSVSVQQVGLPNKDAIAVAKAHWGERLSALRDVLEE